MVLLVLVRLVVLVIRICILLTLTRITNTVMFSSIYVRMRAHTIDTSTKNTFFICNSIIGTTIHRMVGHDHEYKYDAYSYLVYYDDY